MVNETAVEMFNGNTQAVTDGKEICYGIEIQIECSSNLKTSIKSSVLDPRKRYRFVLYYYFVFL